MFVTIRARKVTCVPLITIFGNCGGLNNAHKLSGNIESLTYTPQFILIDKIQREEKNVS